MRSPFLVGFGLAGAMIFVPNSLAAAPDWLGNPTCTTGALRVCVSVDVLQQGTTVQFRVTNLAGLYGSATNTITALGFYHLGTAWTGSVTGRTVLNSGVGGTQFDPPINVSGNWNTDPPYNPSSQIVNNGGGHQIELGVDVNGINKGVKNNEVFTFTLNLSGAPFQFTDDTQLRWHAQNIGATGQSIKCDTYWSDSGSYPPCSVVPEPISMVLLGTGLAGIGGVGVIRRRRRGLEASDG